MHDGSGTQVPVRMGRYWAVAWYSAISYIRVLMGLITCRQLRYSRHSSGMRQVCSSALLGDYQLDCCVVRLPFITS